MNKVFIILGPTSSGKTSLAINLAKQHNGEIISADSRQIFKKMDIGTGKIPVTATITTENHENYWILDDAIVWGYDLATPEEYFSAFDFAQYALTKAKEIVEKGKNVFLVGGTGFYIDLFTGNKKPAQVAPNFELRKELEVKTITELQEELMSLNQDVYNSIDTKNPARLIRAIEIEKSEKNTTTPLPYLENTEFIYLGLKAPREFLYQRSDQWLESVWQNGLITETQNLLNQNYGSTKPLNGLIYKSAQEFLAGKDEEMAQQEAMFDIHSYIRRQETYFKKMPNVAWFDITDSEYPQNITNAVESEIDG